MPEKMTIDKILHRGPVTYITTKSSDGQVTLNIICWWTPKINKQLDNLTLGGELITDAFERMFPEKMARIQKISDNMKKRICDDADKFLASTAKPTNQP